MDSPYRTASPITRSRRPVLRPFFHHVLRLLRAYWAHLREHDEGLPCAVPPAVRARRRKLHRAGKNCDVPGCKNAKRDSIRKVLEECIRKSDNAHSGGPE